MTMPSDWDLPALRKLIAQHQATPGGLLPLLHAIQNTFGYVPADTLPYIAEALHQTRADIHGVVSFYHHFRNHPPGRHVIHVCRAEACQARGSRKLEAHIKQTLGVDYHHTTADAEFTLEPVYCLGNCACGPSIRVNDDILGRVDALRFDALIEALTTHAVEIS